MNHAWHQWVLGYNPERQREALARLGFGDPDWRTLAVALAVVCGTVLLLLIATMLYARPRRAPAEQAWQRFCAALARHGVERLPWEGPQALAARVATTRPELAALAARAAAAYVRLRYDATPETAATKALHELEDCTRVLTRWRAPNRR